MSEEAVEKKKRKKYRRIVDVPSPDELAGARRDRLHESLLDNSRKIRDALVVWTTEEELEVEVVVETQVDGNMLAGHYVEKGYEVSYRAGLGDIGWLVFQPITKKRGPRKAKDATGE